MTKPGQDQKWSSDNVVDVNFTSIAGLMSPVPEHRGEALLQVLHSSTGITSGRLTALDAHGRQVTVAALVRGPRSLARPGETGTLVRRLSDAAGCSVGTLQLSTGQNCSPATMVAIAALTPHFAAVAEVATKRRQLGLTSRESEVLAAVAEGHTNAEIARRDCVSVRTVTTHVEAIFRKLGVSNRVQAARVALDCGIVERHNAGITAAHGLAAS
ncbi:hypothetical protein BVC93_13605 [Mycobacterium sp. MS1601]|nr:hypothetical protein BVC93_13605 [Mycobacterium sp. MS1601]